MPNKNNTQNSIIRQGPGNVLGRSCFNGIIKNDSFFTFKGGSPLITYLIILHRVSLLFTIIAALSHIYYRMKDDTNKLLATYRIASVSGGLVILISLLIYFLY